MRLQLTFTGIIFTMITTTRKTEIQSAGLVFMPVAQLMNVWPSSYWNRIEAATVTI